MTNQQINWKDQLLGQLEFYWDYYFTRHLPGLTDEEFFWEPVANCWTVHPNGDGSFRVDLQTWPEPDPPPFTTIAWRMTHLTQIFGERASRQFGDGTFDRNTMYVPGTADDAVAEMTRQHDLWFDGLRALGQDDLTRPTGTTEGPYENDPLAALILHISREVMHHASEVCLMRDLYRNRDTLHK